MKRIGSHLITVAICAVVFSVLSYAGAGLPYLEKIMRGQGVDEQEIERMIKGRVFIAMNKVERGDTLVFPRGTTFLVASGDFYEAHEWRLLSPVRVVSETVYDLHQKN